jgi:hypothetical protein
MPSSQCEVWVSHDGEDAMGFWVVTPYGLVFRYRRFGETYCLHVRFHILAAANMKMTAVWDVLCSLVEID